MKNIVFTYITPFHPERGGIGRVTHTLTIELQKRGYHVFYLIYNSTITIKHEFNYPAPLTYLPSKELMSPENIEFYHRYLQDNNINTVINQSGNFSDSELWLNTGNKNIRIISVLHSSPWVSYKNLWSSDIFPLKNNSKIEKLKRLARIVLYPKIKRQCKQHRIQQFTSLLPKTDFVCPLSKKYYSELNEICPGFEYKYFAIPNPNSYTNTLIQKSKKRKKKQVLFVGLFGSPKREDRIIKIWKRLYMDFPDWELVMVGDGHPDRVRYLRKISSGIPNIRFEGFQNPLPYQQEASIFCMTSNYEGWGMVLTEAMQCGTVPIVFNSFAAATDIITHRKNGILVSPFNMNEYEKELRNLMSDIRFLQQMSTQAKKDIQKFSVENVVNLWEQIL